MLAEATLLLKPGKHKSWLLPKFACEFPSSMWEYTQRIPLCPAIILLNLETHFANLYADRSDSRSSPRVSTIAIANFGDRSVCRKYYLCLDAWSHTLVAVNQPIAEKRGNYKKKSLCASPWPTSEICLQIEYSYFV